jgi:prevent-host-death family protein
MSTATPPSRPKRIFSSREANQDFGQAKRASSYGPVIITDRGRPTHVLMKMDEYRRLRGEFVSLADVLAMDGGEDIEVEFPRVGGFPREVDLS